MIKSKLTHHKKINRDYYLDHQNRLQGEFKLSSLIIWFHCFYKNDLIDGEIIDKKYIN